MFLTVFLQKNVKSSLDISDGRSCLQRQFHLKGHIFLVMHFQDSVCFIFVQFFFLGVFICGKEFQLPAGRKSFDLKVNYFGTVIVLPG